MSNQLIISESNSPFDILMEPSIEQSLDTQNLIKQEKIMLHALLGAKTVSMDDFKYCLYQADLSTKEVDNMITSLNAVLKRMSWCINKKNKGEWQLIYVREKYLIL